MRTSVGQDRLTGLALLHIHYSLELDLDEIITIFARKHPQRMLLADILSDNPTAKLTSICKIVSAQCFTHFSLKMLTTTLCCTGEWGWVSA